MLLAAHFDRVLKLTRLLFCWALLLGLAGNGVALAAPCVIMTDQHQASSATQAAAPCQDQMGGGQKQAPQPSKASGCLAMLACSAALAAPTASSAGERIQHAALDGNAIDTPALIGRNIAPEPEPPTQLT